MEVAVREQTVVFGSKIEVDKRNSRAKLEVPGNPNPKLSLFFLCVNNGQVVVVGFPATALTSGRTRICISAGHSREDLEYAVEKLEEVADKCFLRYGRSAMGA